MNRILSISLVSMLFLTTGCAGPLGMSTYGMKNKSSVLLPDETAPSYAKIKSIDAQLIVKLESLTDPKNLFEQPMTEQNKQGSEDFSGTSPMLDDYEYTIGPADVLSIIVWEHPELTIPAGSERTAEQSGTLVGADGSIYYPYAGKINVAGKALPEVRELLTQRLGRYIESVKLDVRVAAYNSKRVYVVGEVKQPQVATITNIKPTVMEMISQSGGFTENADSSNVTLTRNGETFRIDLLSLYENGDASQNVVLQSGDVVNVWDDVLNKVFVLGEVNTPGSYFLNKNRKSLAEAISDAGGVNESTSNPSQVYVIRSNGADNKPEIFHLDARTPDALILADRFPLLARDVVYVDAAKVVRWSRVINNVSGTIATLNNASNTDFPLFNRRSIR